MTLTELKYIIAVAREKHFGRAAKACFVSQPTLSVGIKKLEEELQVKIFERAASELTLTPVGQDIVRQAQMVLEHASEIKEIAKQKKDPLSGPLRLGVIYTVAPYLLPQLVQSVIDHTPQMPLILQENFTHQLLEQLHLGKLDAVILAEPFNTAHIESIALYEEPFMVAVPSQHPLAKQQNISLQALQQEKILLLGEGHCFRDHVLGVCPEAARPHFEQEAFQQHFEGSSLETLKYMVAAGMGVTLVPRLSVPETMHPKERVHYLPLSPCPPSRKIVLAWRDSFTRRAAIKAVWDSVMSCTWTGVQMSQEKWK